jgi:hypothetical protein
MFEKIKKKWIHQQILISLLDRYNFPNMKKQLEAKKKLKKIKSNQLKIK